MTQTPDPEGTPTKIRGIGDDSPVTDQIDVMERVQAEENIERFFSLSLHLLLVAGVDGLMHRCNPAWQEILGWETEALVGASFFDLVHPEDVVETQAEVSRLGAGGETKHFANRYRCCDGSYRKLAWSAVAEPHHRLIYAIAHDITERHEAEQALRESETRLREAERVAALGSWELDLTTDRLIWSDEVYRIFERDPARFQPTYANFLAAIHRDDRDAVDQRYRRSVRQKTAFTTTHRIELSEGRIKWVQERGETRYTAEGTPQSSIGTAQDITESKHQESLLALQARRAEALLELPRIAESADEVGMLQHGLELAEALTDSAISFVHFVNEGESTIELVTWSRRTLADYCELIHETHYPVHSAGIWADAIGKRRPIIINDYNSCTHKQGLPEGHATVLRLISVPVIEHDRVVMLAGVGNKPADYSDVDVESLQLIANELWRLAQHSRAIEKLRLSERILHDTAEGVSITDAAGNLISVNPAFQQITGYTSAEVLGKNPRLLQSGRHDDAFYREMWDDLTESGHWRGEIWNRRKNGEIYPEWMTISAIRDSQQQTTHYVAVFSDISHVKQAQEQIDFLARHDALTQLPNRALFVDRLEHALKRARDESGKLAVLFIDLDRFKVVNDNLGHPIGDAILNQVAQRLTASIRGSDTLARLSGDEFALLLEERADAHSVAALVRHLLETLAAPMSIANRSLVITASIGISLYPNDGDNADSLMREADRAMGASKQQGRNSFQFFTQALTEGAFERLILENALRGAIERNELLLMYQPQIELTSGRLAGVEALIRWQHPGLGLIAPAQFIGLAEDIGIIHDIGAWVLRNACAQMKAWDASGFQVPTVAVNLSVKQLERSDFVNQVKSVLSDCALDPDRLELEVTESMLMRDPDLARAALTALKSLGNKIALDDFGTGYSSLSMLRLLPLHRLKIDQSFVRDIGRNADDEAIVCAIIALANSLGLETVAEGVEDPEQALFLRQKGVDIGQGYSFSKPVPADELAQAWQHTNATDPPPSATSSAQRQA